MMFLPQGQYEHVLSSQANPSETLLIKKCLETEA